MNSAKLAKYNNSLMVILWGLIFSKCFILEYLVQVYAVPINSFIYIWLLTLGMASVATFAFFQLNYGKRRIAVVPSWMVASWLICSVAIFLFFAISFLSTMIAPYTLPALCASVLGIGYLVHGILSSRHVYILSGIGWWIGAGVLFNQNNIHSLLSFAFLILLLSVCPVIVEMKKQKLAFVAKPVNIWAKD